MSKNVILNYKGRLFYFPEELVVALDIRDIIKKMDDINEKDKQLKFSMYDRWFTDNF